MVPAQGIEQILDNVLDNAIAIAPPDTTVTIAIEPMKTISCA